jgi:hypothetical protein
LCSLSVSPVSALGLGSGDALLSSVSAPSVSLASFSVVSSSTSGLALGVTTGLSLGSGLGLASGLSLASGLALSSGLAEPMASTLDVPAERLEWDADTAREPTTIAEPAIAMAAARRVPTRSITVFSTCLIGFLLASRSLPWRHLHIKNA